MHPLHMMSRLMQNLDQFSNLYGQGQLKKKKKQTNVILI